MTGRLEGKVTFITGIGSSGPGWGTGKAIAVTFAREGARIFGFDQSDAAAAETKTLIDKAGLLSRGLSVAATGVAQICELVTQLRREAGARQVENCKTALAQCMGGDKQGDTKSCTISILSR